MEKENKVQEIEAIPLHLELAYQLTEEERRILKAYGRMRFRFSRQILVPADMPLHNLHYAIQRLFGWQNSHLHCFELSEADYMRLTGGTVKGWADLCGILFRASDGEGDEYYWDDDYERGSFKKWLQNKYQGPFYDGAEAEVYANAQRSAQELLQWASEKFENVPVDWLTLEELNRRIYIENGTTSLLERLAISDVLVPYKTFLSPAARIKQSFQVKNVTHELIYRYDFGDNWTIKIRRMEDVQDLSKINPEIDSEELKQAVSVVQTQHKPVCVGQDGMFLLDDVGGLSGFVSMLEAIYEGDDEVEAEEYKEWASGQGWNGRRMANRLVL